MENSMLAMLPPELRTNIYEMVVCRADVELDVTHGERGMKPWKKDSVKMVQDAHALLLSCRQVAAEVTPLFYGNNTFRVNSTGGHIRLVELMIHGWLRMLGRNAPLLRHVEVETSLVMFHYLDDEDATDEEAEKAANEKALIVKRFQRIFQPSQAVISMKDVQIVWTEDASGEEEMGLISFPLRNVQDIRIAIDKEASDAEECAVDRRGEVWQVSTQEDIGKTRRSLGLFIDALVRHRVINATPV